MKAKRERFHDQQKRIYDPAVDTVVGRDSPGSKYNTNQQSSSKIRKSNFFAMPKEKRVLIFNSANGQGAEIGSCNPELSTFKKLKVNAVFGKAERKF